MSESAQQTATCNQCRHIRSTGRRCRMVALTGEPFCFYHHRARRPEPIAFAPKYPDAGQAAFGLPVLEDRPAIQLALTEVLARVASNDIDLKRANTLLYGFQIAISALPREPRPAIQPTKNEPDEDASHSETTLHPTLGLLAPESPIPMLEPDSSPSAEEIQRDLRRQLREAKRALEDTPCPHCNLLPPLPHRWDDEDVMKLNPNIPHRPKHPTPCKPIVLPNLQACTDPLQPTGYNLKPNDKTPPPNHPEPTARTAALEQKCLLRRRHPWAVVKAQPESPHLRLSLFDRSLHQHRIGSNILEGAGIR